MTIRFDGRVAVVTGAGAGLGRSHALELAARGVRVVVNDFGGARDGSGGSSAAALAVVEEIRTAGGTAVANGANVADNAQVQGMVEQAMSEFGRIDILVNNAGILRDKSFSRLEVVDIVAVLDVHLMGSMHCTKAVWDIMRKQEYGRIVMTTSSSGMYGNFGQSNYGAAKMAVIGLMNALALEGEKNNVRVNALAPAAATRMTEDILPEAVLQRIQPERVTPGLIFLCSEEAPSKTILLSGGGSFAVARMMETAPVMLDDNELTPEAVAARFNEIANWDTARAYEECLQQVQSLLAPALR
jgi:NAD(P)-dependent dehydrogenase (short-subunit alcohol dehydrogenase family)